MSDPRQQRLTAALMRLCEHTDREQHWRQQAASAPDPDHADRYTQHAEAAHRDALAIAREHHITF